MKDHAYGCAALISVVLGFAPFAEAELEPISETAMGDVTGQAFMQIENIPGAAHEFTRMTLNMDVETRVNIDDAQLGQINGGTDYAAQHVALGHIARADGEQFNGVTYNKDDIVPFEARKPYIELAEDSAGLAGFRMGFAQARGSVSSHTASFSGDIGLKFEDNTGAQYDAVLMDSTGTATKKRASHVGISPGNCTQGANCAPLTDLRSINVGAANDGFTDGFFIGFQREGMDWQTLDGANTINAGKGVFINLPTNMTVNLGDFVNGGVDRLHTHQVDMGTNLF